MKKNQVLVSGFAQMSSNNPVSETTGGNEMYNIAGNVTFVRYALGQMNKKVKDGKLDKIEPGFQKAWDAGLKFFYNIPDPCPVKGEGRLPEAIDVISGKTSHFESEAKLKATFISVHKALPEDWQEICGQYVKSARKAFDLEEPAKSKTVKKTSPAKSKEVSKPVILMAERLIELGNTDWSLIDESLIKKISDSCKQAKVTLKDVRTHFESLLPEPEETDEFDIGF